MSHYKQREQRDHP